MMSGIQMEPTDSEQVLNQTMNGEKPLGRRYGLEPSHLGFWLRCGLMRDFNPVMIVGGLFDGPRKEKDVPRSPPRMAWKLVGDRLPGYLCLMFQPFGESSAERLDDLFASNMRGSQRT